MISNQFKGSNVTIYFLTAKKTNAWEAIGIDKEIVYSKYQNQYFGAIAWCLSLLFKSHNKKYTYIFTSHVFVTGLIGILIRIGLINKQYFIGRESTHIFKRFKGYKLWLYKMMYKYGYSALDLLICQTDTMKEELVKALPYLEKKINLKVIPNPIDLKNIKISEDIDFHHKNEKYIVSAGRLIPEKGFNLLIKVFNELKKEQTDIKLIILGEGPEGNKLKELIEKYNLKEDVILKGFVPNVYPYFQYAQVCVVSSYVEGFPNVLLQMMAKNTKVVSTNCAGGIDQIEGVFLSEVNNKLDLKKKIDLALISNTIDNRYIFDTYLHNRSIEKFMEKIYSALKLKTN
jgi:glycosyltransferase involved in cell wall biosynthesis